MLFSWVGEAGEERCSESFPPDACVDALVLSHWVLVLDCVLEGRGTVPLHPELTDAEDGGQKQDSDDTP